MKLFRRDKVHAFADSAASGLASSILKVQRAFADRMGKVSASWNRSAKIFFLACVCIVFATMSVVAITSSFSGKNVERPKAIKVIRHTEVDIVPKVTKEEFERVQQFKSKLDSAIIQQRPGLMDSIRMVEENYYSNK